MDLWRELAAMPLPGIRWEAERKPDGDVHTLIEDGVVIGTWRQQDVPWLEGWLADRLRQLYGAWNIAFEARLLTEGQRRAGTGRAATLKAEAKRRDERLRKAAKQVLVAEGPMPNSDLAEILADRGLGAPSVIVKKLPKLLKPAK